MDVTTKATQGYTIKDLGDDLAAADAGDEAARLRARGILLETRHADLVERMARMFRAERDAGR